MFHAAFTEQGFVAATSGDNGNGMAQAGLLDGNVHRGVHDAIAAVGDVVQYVENPHSKPFLSFHSQDDALTGA
jgi:hypothetical protein